MVLRGGQLSGGVPKIIFSLLFIAVICFPFGIMCYASVFFFVVLVLGSFVVFYVCKC